MAFLADGTLLLSVGEGYVLREDAQKKSQLGKLLRMTKWAKHPQTTLLITLRLQLRA